jgi:hypothetical protein
MKAIAGSTLFLLTVFFGFGQQPVHWSFTAKKLNANLFEIHITGKIDKPWHTYSQTTPDGGPSPTHIKFSRNPLVSFKGKINEVGDLRTIHDDAFGVDVKYFDEQIDFVQVISVRSNVKTKQSGSIEFMVCNDHQCLPPKTLDFNIALN